MVVWRFLDVDGAEVGASDPFEDQAEAEAWLTNSWRDLLTDGVESVEMFDESAGTVVYRMGLRSV
jgi:hypothetical protein